MSVNIPVAFVNSFRSNVFHLAQQKGSRLVPLCRVETQNAEKDFYDYLGAETAKDKTGRHSDVEYSDVVHGRRACFISDKYHASLVDKEDKLRMIYDPENEYAVAARNALGRAMDDVIIAAALGTSYSGKEGTVPVVLPTSQKVAAFDGTTTTGVGLNVKTLRAVKKKFNQNEVDGEISAIVSSEEIDSMLGQTEVTSSDYNSVKALVDGMVDSFMSFRFTRSERLLRSATNVTYTVTNGVVGAGTGTIQAIKSRRCIFFEKSGLIFARAAEAMGRIDEIAHKHYAKQVYSSMTVGATRLEETRVVEVITSEP